MIPPAAPDPVRIEPIDPHSDARGVVFEPLTGTALAGQRNVHVVITEPGAVRGNHVHRRATETLVVRGPARVRYRFDGNVRDVDVAAGEVMAFTFPPGVAHAIRAEGRQANVLVAFRDTTHDRAEPDVEAVALLEPRDVSRSTEPPPRG
jgi:dTDP-4-dehydrorhamnose 3,5-epimerase-like enzyme